jgi:hypothetical protein
VPFLIKLRELNDPAHPPAPEQFPGLVAALGGKPEHWAHQRLKSGKALVLIDGIDEALEGHRPQIQSWLKDLVSQYPDARYVVTSREPLIYSAVPAAHGCAAIFKRASD